MKTDSERTKRDTQAAKGMAVLFGLRGLFRLLRIRGGIPGSGHDSMMLSVPVLLR